ncbi:transcription initiation factor IIB [Sorochytrium milnesiophthora]
MDAETFRLVQPEDARAAKYQQVSGKQQADLNVRLMCQVCRDPTPNIVEDFKQGDLVCGTCGTVFKDRIIDTRSEWRTFSNDENTDDPSRVGAAADPLLGNALNMETTISRRDGGKGASRELNKVHAKTSAAKGQRNILQAFKDIANLGERMGLPRNIIDTAKQMYKKADDDKLIKGKHDAVVATCVVLACRANFVPRTFKEMAEVTKVPKNDIGKVFSALKQHLLSETTQMNPENISDRFCNQLGLSVPITRQVQDMCRKARSLPGLDGRSPNTIVGACVYLVTQSAGLDVSCRDIAEVVSVSEATIKSAHRILSDQVPGIANDA